LITKGGLGKGLGALIPTGARSLEEISPSSITPNPRQPRRHFDEEALASLASSIKRLGLLQPVVVRRTANEDYELVMGERRLRAAQRAGLSAIPALIIDTDDRGSLERALVENVHRRDLNPIEEAAAYRQMLDEAGLTHEELGERLGLSRPSITNAMRLLELPESIQKLVIDGKLSSGHAKTLLGLGSHPLLERIGQKIAAAGLSVRETEDLVRREREHLDIQADQAQPKPTARAKESFGEWEERLADVLNTTVHIAKGRRKGKIVIEFATKQDLNRLVAAIVSVGDAASLAGRP